MSDTEKMQMIVDETVVIETALKASGRLGLTLSASLFRLALNEKNSSPSNAALAAKAYFDIIQTTKKPQYKHSDTYETVLDIGGSDFDIVCFYEYTKGCKGSWADGLQVEPDEEPVVEISSIKLNYAQPDEPDDFQEIDLPYPIIRNLEAEALRFHE